MSTNTLAGFGQYALATGANAVGRLDLLHSIYSPVGGQVLAEAGLTTGMDVADFGCGTGHDPPHRFIGRTIGQCNGN